jgi:hypothetical protein
MEIIIIKINATINNIVNNKINNAIIHNKINKIMSLLLSRLLHLLNNNKILVCGHGKNNNLFFFFFSLCSFSFLYFYFFFSPTKMPFFLLCSILVFLCFFQKKNTKNLNLKTLTIKVQLEISFKHLFKFRKVFFF